MVSASAEIKSRYGGKPRDANDGRREPEAAVLYSIALGGERYLRFFRTAYDVAIGVDFIGNRMHMKVTLGGFDGGIEHRIGDIAPTENAAGQ
jgi:hypothetical protein